MIDIARAPFPVTVRELWLPRAINGVGLPSSRHDGHPLTLTGAKLGSTADGVHFDGVNTTYIDMGALFNGGTKLWIHSRFRLDQDFDAGDASQYLWSKRLDGTNRLTFYLEGSDGKLKFWHYSGGATKFNCQSVETSWVAGQWYDVIASMSDDGATQVDARLIVDAGTPVTATDAGRTALPAGGIVTLGAQPTASGSKVTIVDYTAGTDDLTGTEEDDLSKGIPPADAVNSLLLDEGRGVTAYDRGSGGNNGTLTGACVWAFGECKQPVLSLDGINDVAISSVGVDLSSDWTLVSVWKIKSTYDGLAAHRAFLTLYIDVDNIAQLYCVLGTNNIRFFTVAGGVAKFCDYTGVRVIDDYLIIINVFDVSGDTQSMYANGSLSGSVTGLGAMAGAATCYINRHNTATWYNLSKPLLTGLFDTAWTAKQVKAFSRWLNDTLSLGVKI